MAKVQGPDKDPEGNKSGVGGKYAAGNNPDPGGATETVEVTPGEVRNQGPTGSAEGTASSKAFDPDRHAPAPGPTPPVSDEERSGMSGTDMNPHDPNAVGESHTDKAYEDGPDHTEGHKDESDRPYGDHSPQGQGVGGGKGT